MKVIKITCCGECPNISEIKSGMSGQYRWYCKLVNPPSTRQSPQSMGLSRLISIDKLKYMYDKNTIPSWCPLEDAPEEGSVTEWINVKDRLPEKEGLYLVWDTPYSSSTNKLMIGYFNPHTKKWETDIAEDWSHVSHWMPLPEQPEGA